MRRSLNPTVWTANHWKKHFQYMLLFNSLRHAAWNHQWRLARRGWCYSMWRCPNRHIIQTFFVRLSSTRRGSRHSSSVNLDITSATGAHIFPHNWYLTVTKSPTLRFPSNARHPQSPAHLFVFNSMNFFNFKMRYSCHIERGVDGVVVQVLIISTVQYHWSRPWEG